MADLFDRSLISPEEIPACAGCDFIIGISKRGGVCELSQIAAKPGDDGGKQGLRERLNKYTGQGLSLSCPRAGHLEDKIGGCVRYGWKSQVNLLAPRNNFSQCDGCTQIKENSLGLPTFCGVGMSMLYAVTGECITIASNACVNLHSRCPNKAIFTEIAGS